MCFLHSQWGDTSLDHHDMGRFECWRHIARPFLSSLRLQMLLLVQGIRFIVFDRWILY